jgi:hypothetical protein
MSGRRLITTFGFVAFLVALAVPALAARPDGQPGPGAEHTNNRPSSPPGLANKPDMPGPDKPHKPRPEKPSKALVTISGSVRQSTDTDGRLVFTVEDGDVTYTLESGPPWFYSDNHPLRRYVGRHVVVTGEVAEGSREIDVATIDGNALREPGRPPWAGGWRAVGDGHPGWSAEKGDRFRAGCWPPGHCKAATEQD